MRQSCAPTQKTAPRSINVTIITLKNVGPSSKLELFCPGSGPFVLGTVPLGSVTEKRKDPRNTEPSSADCVVQSTLYVPGARIGCNATSISCESVGEIWALWRSMRRLDSVTIAVLGGTEIIAKPHAYPCRGRIEYGILYRV